jgi:hypothetical protein
MFRDVDVEHMGVHGVQLADYGYMSTAANDHANAHAVLNTLERKTMPPGGPFWSAEMIARYKQWMADGYLP